jgi:hypothetical protein
MNTHAVQLRGVVRDPASRVPLTVRAAQALLLLPLGAVVLFGATYFGLIDPTSDVDALGYAVCAWGLAQGVAAIAVGARLGRGEERMRLAASGLVLLHAVFGVVKILGYDEPEAGVFIAVDLFTLALLWSPSARKLTVS